MRNHRATVVLLMPLVLSLALTSCGREVEGGAFRSDPAAATLPPSATSSLARASGTPAPLGTPTQAPGSRESPPPSTSPRPSAESLEIFDAHIHYSQDAWALYTPERAIEILRAAGIRKALVSSTPDSGTQRLFALAPDLVVPMLRPYRSREDIGAWTRDPTVIAYVESTFRPGVHRGIGEFHLVSGDAATPVIRALVAMAIREDLWLQAHADEQAIAELARSDRRAKVLWGHAGLSSTPAAVGAVLEAYPNVVAELALRSDVMWGQTIDPGWRELLLRYPDRFLVGTDTWTPSRWEDVVSGHQRTRAWLMQLPPDVASKIAGGNADRLFVVRR